MNSHSKIRLISTLVLSTALIAFGSVPASFAATKTTPAPKATAKTLPKPATTAKANPSITKLPTTTGSDDPNGNRGGRFANLTTVQRACLVKAGVTLPTPRATGVRPTAAPNPSRSPGAFGGGNTFSNPKTIAAYKKCGITLPTGGFGGGTFNSAKFQAFQKCMTTAGFQSSGGFGRYDESDPSTVAALIKCQKSSGFTLPKPGQPGGNN